MKTKSSRKRKSARRAEPTREQVAALIRRAEWWCRLVERRLRARRLAMGRSHEWVAVWAALSRQEVSNVERGRHNPWLETALRMAFALGLGVDEVFSTRKPAWIKGRRGC